MDTHSYVSDYPEPEPASQIAPGLWMGGTASHELIAVAQQLRGFQPDRPYDAVLTLFAHASPASWGVEERRFGFPDRQVIGEYVPILHDLADWAYDRWDSGRRVLIRCAAGMNRSGLLTAMVLMRSGYSADDAVELIRARRHPFALNNYSFVRLLRGQSDVRPMRDSDNGDGCAPTPSGKETPWTA